MSRTLRGILALVAVAAVTVTAPAAAQPTAASDAVESSVVILTNTGTGSGSIVGDGQVLTAAHVLEGASDIQIQTGSGGAVAAVQISDSERDLALLSVPGLDGPALDLRDNPAQIGEAAYAVGAPSGRYLQISRGIVSAVVNQSGVERVQTDAPVNPGNSGGPLVDENGDVLGVVVTKSRTEEGIAFATSTAEVRDFLGDDAVPSAQEPSTVGESGSSSDLPSSPSTTVPVDSGPSPIVVWMVLVALVSMAVVVAVLQRRQARRRKSGPILDLTFEDLSSPIGLNITSQELGISNQQLDIRTTEPIIRKEEEQWTI